VAGSFIAYAYATATASGTTLTTDNGTAAGVLNVLVGDALAYISTYDAGDTTVTYSTDFSNSAAQPTEDTSIQKVSQSPRMRVSTFIATQAANTTVTLTPGAARTNRGVLVVQIRGLAAYLGGVFPAYFNPGSGNDLVTPGNYNVVAQPNYMLGIAWDQAGGGTAPPNGTTSVFTSRGTFWNMADATANGRFSDFRATANGNVAPTFNSGFGGHSYAALQLAWSESGGGGGNKTIRNQGGWKFGRLSPRRFTYSRGIYVPTPGLAGAA
jgi:hypothetical protein